jgi:hypothetical protein
MSKTELLGNHALPFPADTVGIFNEKHNSVSAILMYLPTASPLISIENDEPSETTPSAFLSACLVYRIFVGIPLIAVRYILILCYKQILKKIII